LRWLKDLGQDGRCSHPGIKKGYKAILKGGGEAYAGI